MKERTPGREKLKSELNSAIDTIRKIGVITKEIFLHPNSNSVIIYDAQTREIKVTREPSKS